LFFILIFAGALALSACGDNSQIIASRDSGSEQDDENDEENEDAGSTPDADEQPDAGFDDASNPDTGPTDPCLQTTPAEAAEFATQYAAALCERVFSCEQNPRLAQFVTLGGWTSVEKCTDAVLAGTISAGQAEQAAAEGTLTLDSCAATICLEGVAKLDCTGLHRVFTENYTGQITSCYDAWVGDISRDQACSVDAQCEGDQICFRDPNAPTCQGTCVDAGVSGSGSCGDITCRADQYCTVENNICMTRPAIGDACNESEDAAPAERIPCRTNATCEGGICVAIEADLPADSTCDLQKALCSFDLVCLGTCTAAGAEGDSCNFAGCEAGLYCSDQGVCEARGAAGASCTSDDQCLSLRCAGGSCTDVNALCQ
jgi:hypothetical protein